MASFSLSKSSLNLTPPSITGGPPSKASIAGAAASTAAQNWINLRRGAPDFAAMVAQNSASKANIFNAMKDAEMNLMKGGLQGYTSAIIGKKTADRMKEQAKDQASKSMWSSGLGAVGTIGGSLIGGPIGGMIGGGIGSAIGGFLG